jgi:hypothetical protein
MTVRADGIYNRTLVVHVAKDGTPTGLSGTLNAYGYFTNVGTGKTASVQEEGQYTAVVNPADLLHHFSETLSGRVDFFLVAGDVVTYQGQVLPAPGIYQITGRVTIDHTTDTGTAIGTKLIRFCDLLAAP